MMLTSGLATYPQRARWPFRKILAIGLVAYLIPKRLFFLDLAESMIDQSWMLGLNLALREKLVWGKEVVFTYGPLGYLSTGVPFYASGTLILLFYAFVVANGIHFVNHVLNKAATVREMAFLVLILFFNGQFLFMRDTVTLFFFFLFHIHLYLRNGSLLSLAAISCCALLSFYIKANTGILLNVLMVAFLLFDMWSDSIGKMRKMAFLLLHFALLAVLSVWLRVDMYGYIVNGLSIIDAYNDAMYLPSPWRPLSCAISILALMALPYLRSPRRVLLSARESFLAFGVSLFAFILFKQGFVRSDHGDIFMLGSTFAAILAALSTSLEVVGRRLRQALPIIGFLTLFGYQGSRLLDVKRNTGYTNVTESSSKSWVWVRRMSLLPADLTDRIGDRGVDVMGYLVSLVFYNGFKYEPRPVFQSYNAYAPPLMALNAAKYGGSEAPDFVMYHFGSIDNRHPLWDEPQTLMQLMADYRLTDTIQTVHGGERLMLFERSEHRRKWRSRVVLDSVARFGTRIPIPRSDGILFLQMETEMTLAGKLRRILYHPSETRILLNHEDGGTQSCRVIAPIMESGVPVNWKVTTEPEAFEFLASCGRKGKATLSFEVQGDSSFVRDGFVFRLLEYTFED